MAINWQGLLGMPNPETGLLDARAMAGREGLASLTGAFGGLAQAFAPTTDPGAMARGLAAVGPAAQRAGMGAKQTGMMENQYARQGAMSEALGDKPDADLTQVGRTYRGLLAGLPASARQAMALLPPEQQGEIVSKLLTQRTNPRDRYMEVGGTLVDVSGDAPRSVLRPEKLLTPAEQAQQEAIRAAGRSNNVTNVRLPPMENSFATATGTALAGDANALAAAGGKSAELLRRLQQFEMASTGVNTGMGGAAAITVGQLAQRLGIPDGALPAGLNRNATASGEEIRALGGQLLQGQIGAGGFPSQNFSNADREMLEKTLPGLANTPQGNTAIIAAMRAGAGRNLEVSRAWRDWQMKNGTNADSFLRFQQEALPKITERDILAPLAPAPKPGVQADPPASAASPVRVRTVEEARRLPPGTRFLDPNGIERTAR